MASQAIYCTNQDIKDVYPHVDEYDQKTRLLGWVLDSTNLYASHDCGNISMIYVNKAKGGSMNISKASCTENGDWFYDSTEDVVYYFDDRYNLTLGEVIMESGVDYSTLLTRFRTNASRYVDGRLDSRVRAENWKNRHGSYNYNVIRASALIACGFMIKAHDTDNAIAESFMEEADHLIELINSGAIVLDDQVTKDSSSGIIREVSITGGGLRPVDLKGSYNSSDYDLIKIWVDTTGGVIGTATYSVAVKDSTGLKAQTVVDQQIINGQYQLVTSGLYVRWAGTDDSATATATDEWEIEVYGTNVSVDNSAIGTMRMTRL